MSAQRAPSVAANAERYVHADDRVNVEAVPRELVERDRWVLWRYGQPVNGRRPKVPYAPGSSRRKIDVTNPTLWSSFEDVCAAYATDRYDGIGHVAGDGLAGVDLDHCLHPETGEVHPTAATIVDELASCVEVTPSGRGLRVWVRTTESVLVDHAFAVPFWDGVEGAENGKVELYEAKRYFTVTGWPLPGASATIAERTDAFRQLHDRLVREKKKQPSAERPRTRTDDELIDHLCRDERSRALWSGDTSAYGDDDSRADLALCARLAHLCANDAERIDRLFRRSRLMREKWDRDDYRERTIETALRASFTRPEHWRRVDEGEPWTATPVTPIVENLVARGRLVFVGGDPYSYKSLFTAYVAKFMIVGGELFDRYRVEPVERVWYLELEDPESRVKERFDDTRSEFPDFPRGRLCYDFAPGLQLNDPEMFGYLEAEVEREGFDVVFVNTYQAATPGASSFDDAEQTRIMHRLRSITRRLDVTIVVVDHTRKEGSGRDKRTEVSLADLRGTNLKPANIDTTILLDPVKNSRQLRLRTHSKDFDDQAITLAVSPRGSTGAAKFSYAGEVANLGAASEQTGAENYARVTKIFRAGERLTVKEIADRAGVSESTARRHLREAVENGDVIVHQRPGKANEYERAADPDF